MAVRGLLSHDTARVFREKPLSRVSWFIYGTHYKRAYFIPLPTWLFYTHVTGVFMLCNNIYIISYLNSYEYVISWETSLIAMKTSQFVTHQNNIHLPLQTLSKECKFVLCFHLNVLQNRQYFKALFPDLNNFLQYDFYNIHFTFTVYCLKCIWENFI